MIQIDTWGENSRRRTARKREGGAEMNIRHQYYYTWRGRECRKIIEELTAGSRGPEGYYIGNIVKYLYRYKWKNGIEDLKKAEEYLHLLIAYNVENERIRQSVMERK